MTVKGPLLEGGSVPIGVSVVPEEPPPPLQAVSKHVQATASMDRATAVLQIAAMAEAGLSDVGIVTRRRKSKAVLQSFERRIAKIDLSPTGAVDQPEADRLLAQRLNHREGCIATASADEA